MLAAECAGLQAPHPEKRDKALVSRATRILEVGVGTLGGLRSFCLVAVA